MKSPEDTDILDAKIRYRCRRGTLELDTLLDNFCNKILPTCSESEKHMILQYLDTYTDPEIQMWCLDKGDNVPPAPVKPFIEMVKKANKYATDTE